MKHAVLFSFFYSSLPEGLLQKVLGPVLRPYARRLGSFPPAMFSTLDIESRYLNSNLCGTYKNLSLDIAGDFVTIRRVGFELDKRWQTSNLEQQRGETVPGK